MDSYELIQTMHEHLLSEKANETQAFGHVYGAYTAVCYFALEDGPEEPDTWCFC